MKCGVLRSGKERRGVTGRSAARRGAGGGGRTRRGAAGREYARRGYGEGKSGDEGEVR